MLDDEESHETKESEILMLIHTTFRLISILKHTTLQQLSRSAYFYYFSFGRKKKEQLLKHKIFLLPDWIR